MDKKLLIKSVIEALVEDEFQENTNYNDIAEAVFRIYNEKLLPSTHEKVPKMEDFYDTTDPRGISNSEYNEYYTALKEWQKIHN